ncbi:MAG: F390 synthetase-related protein [Polaromonas sp.]
MRLARLRHLAWLLLAYWQARRLRFASRAALEAHQAQALARFKARLCAQSPYFSAFKHLPLGQWPVMDKATMMAHFDTMNTQALALGDVLAKAHQAEQQRDFTPTLASRSGALITVGLSSGTSGQRAVFAVSAREQAQWAGVLLAHVLPHGLRSGQRAALFLRANSNLYTAVRSRWLAFEFFDLFEPFDSHLVRLAHYQPTLLVAPAQVLRQLALAQQGGQLRITPQRVISVAEVLEPQDRTLIEQVFGPVHEVYQATEGFLASTCPHGTLHLHEAHLHMEPQWLDDAQTRFVPIITDFSRMTQPIVRYRLDDVLVLRPTPCPCGQATRALLRIEGRCDDQLQLADAQGRAVVVFSDVLSRALAQVLPLTADYRLVQDGPALLHLHADLALPELARVQRHLQATLQALGVHTAALRWALHQDLAAFEPTRKRRRIYRLPPPPVQPSDVQPSHA